MFTLYVVATPIGNLEDISLRALRILRTVRLIAAEDTRKTRILLNAYDIKTPLTSYHEHNKYAKLDYLLRFLSETGDVAVVSEAGTPGISDPGHELIVAADRQGMPIVPIPGASVVVTAVAVSTLPTERFTFLGFMPRRPGDRRQLLKSVIGDPGTLVILEAPHRLQDTLSDLLSTLGDRRIAVCRELTKIHEEVFRGRISEAVDRFTEPRGEFTLVVEGRTASEKPGLTGDVERRLREMRLAGMTAREAISRISSDTGLARKDLYRAWLRLG
ncbi:MAG: 16S rRNA (cytidine(1402)-2'-O)-methyltransferase [Chloroflexi bacterium RBG_16_57_8]|nr:MAG: 16S rRNA (cytidine(1402)-2'-O)-methyltransferase [Chloroflexi bacterium RBG_16_57_8]